MKERVVLAMSGGVDSSVAASLLQQAGYEVLGLFMRSGETEPVCQWDPQLEEAPQTCLNDEQVPDEYTSEQALLPVIQKSNHKQGCCSASDAADARRVADLLDIPFYALNFQDAFGRIKDYFADEYLAGRTPNPCVMCNNWLKFGKLWDFARQVGATRIATGHYARIDHHASNINEGACPVLRRGIDLTKDQSYVLFGIDRELLPRILFPVGEYNKTEIRKIASNIGMQTANKPDSQEICFVPDNDYAGFLKRYRGVQSTAGELVNLSGDVLGYHEGYEKFTIGQRRGLGVTFGEPRYVIGIDAQTNRVIIGQHEDLARDSLEADQLNWLGEDMPHQFSAMVKIRYRHPGAKAEVTRIDANRISVRFEESQYGIAPGQAVVCYDGDRLLGGGWICS